MARTIDITDKLGMAGRPELVIGKARVTVDDSARTMLRVLSLIGDGSGVGAQTLLDVYEMLFDAKARKAIDALDLSWDDFSTVLFSAIDLVTDGGEGGNAATPATT